MIKVEGNPGPVLLRGPGDFQTECSSLRRQRRDQPLVPQERLRVCGVGEEPQPERLAEQHERSDDDEEEREMGQIERDEL